MFWHHDVSINEPLPNKNVVWHQRLPGFTVHLGTVGTRLELFKVEDNAHRGQAPHLICALLHTAISFAGVKYWHLNPSSTIDPINWSKPSNLEISKPSILQSWNLQSITPTCCNDRRVKITWFCTLGSVAAGCPHRQIIFEQWVADTEKIL